MSVENQKMSKEQFMEQYRKDKKDKEKKLNRALNDMDFDRLRKTEKSSRKRYYK